VPLLVYKWDRGKAITEEESGVVQSSTVIVLELLGKESWRRVILRGMEGRQGWADDGDLEGSHRQAWNTG
jgi:hypothetical protein